MRVMLVTGSFPPMRCGVGDYTCQLAAALASRPGVEVAVITGRAAETAAAPSGVSIFTPVGAWRVRDVPAILSVLRQWRPDVVHIQYPTQGYGRSHIPTLLPLLCRLAGYRVVQTWHEVRQRVTAGGLFWLLSQIPVSGGLIFVRPRFEEMMAPLLRIVLRNKTRRFIPNASVFPRTVLTAAEKALVCEKFGRPRAALVVYFGFIYPAKGVDRLFEICAPETQHVVIIGEPGRGEPDAYLRSIEARANSEPWLGKVTLTGFLAAEDAARIIAAADAVVLPFLGGGGEWNTSIHGAQAQGTFLVTTSEARQGYDADTNTYFARPGDTAGMRDALARYIGFRNAHVSDSMAHSWQAISAAHLDLYRELAPVG